MWHKIILTHTNTNKNFFKYFIEIHIEGLFYTYISEWSKNDLFHKKYEVCKVSVLKCQGEFKISSSGKASNILLHWYYSKQWALWCAVQISLQDSGTFSLSCWECSQQTAHGASEFLVTLPKTIPFPQVQFSSVAQSCQTLCDPMDCSTPGFPVHHQIPELTQTYVHWVGDSSGSLPPMTGIKVWFPHPNSEQLWKAILASEIPRGELRTLSRLQCTPSSAQSASCPFLP